MRNHTSLTWTIILSFFAGLIFFAGCEKVDVPKGTPKCIKDKIKEDIKNGNCLNSVYEYSYRGEKVYLFNMKNCIDGGPYLWNEECKRGCSTTFGGGWYGNDTSFCNNFQREKTNEKLIWKK